MAPYMSSHISCCNCTSDPDYGFQPSGTNMSMDADQWSTCRLIFFLPSSRVWLTIWLQFVGLQDDDSFQELHPSCFMSLRACFHFAVNLEAAVYVERHFCDRCMYCIVLLISKLAINTLLLLLLLLCNGDVLMQNTLRMIENTGKKNINELRFLWGYVLFWRFSKMICSFVCCLNSFSRLQVIWNLRNSVQLCELLGNGINVFRVQEWTHFLDA